MQLKVTTKQIRSNEIGTFTMGDYTGRVIRIDTRIIVEVYYKKGFLDVFPISKGVSNSYIMQAVKVFCVLTEPSSPREYVEQLPEKNRIVIEHCYGLNGRKRINRTKIAQLLGVSHQTVSLRILKGIEKIKHRVKEIRRMI